MKVKPVTKYMRVLTLLKEEKVVTNSRLSRISLRYGSIIHDLRKDGHKIVTNRVNDRGLFEYVYKGKKRV